jgi:hypothetical protein
MKKLVLTLALSAIASTAFAGGGKISILHCGVDEGGDVMRYVAISVSKRAKGHMNHVAGSTDSVDTGEIDGNGEAIYVDYERTNMDCLLEGEGGLANSVNTCSSDFGQVEGLECGQLVAEQI